MSTIDADRVRRVAKLARLELDDPSVSLFAAQLDQVLEYVALLEKLDTRNTSPMTHPLAQQNVLRPDEPRASLPAEAALANAPDRLDAAFRVPAVLDGGA